MNLENIKEGMIIKNYRELCRLLEIEVEAGNSKKAQLKELSRFIKFYKEGQKFIVEEIYLKVKNKVDLRSVVNKTKYFGRDNPVWKDYNELEVSYDLLNNIGVYKITLDNKIYIGSTIAGFRKRFIQHYKGKNPLMQHTHELLQQGGRFEILHDMTGIEDEALIRMMEDECIKMYLLNPEWEVINRKDSAHSYTEKKEKDITIKFKVKEDKYYEVIQLLVKNGLIDGEVEI